MSTTVDWGSHWKNGLEEQPSFTTVILRGACWGESRDHLRERAKSSCLIVSAQNIQMFVSRRRMGFPGGLLVKNLPAMQETWVWSLGWDDTMENEMATHSCILAWKIPWTETPGWLQSMRSQNIWTQLSNWSIITHKQKFKPFTKMLMSIKYV